MSDVEISPGLAKRRREKKQRGQGGGKALDPNLKTFWQLGRGPLMGPLLAEEREPSRDREGDIRAETKAYDEAVTNDALDATYVPDPVVLDVPDEDV
jgi:hypothetical protein